MVRSLYLMNVKENMGQWDSMNKTDDTEADYPFHENDTYIDDWSEIPDNSIVVEDTYNEIYVIFSKDGKRYLKQVGWQIPIDGDDAKYRKMEKRDREIDFSPNAMYDQPWILLKNKSIKDY